MTETVDKPLDFANVSFGDFGRLSMAQKVGFLVTLPIALPVVILVKLFHLAPGDEDDSFPAMPDQTKVSEQPYDPFLDDWNQNERHRYDADWYADEAAYGTMIADMSVESELN